MAAMNASSPGDTIAVAPGVYRELVIIPHDNIKLVAQGEVIITGADPVAGDQWIPDGSIYKAVIPKDFFDDSISDIDHHLPGKTYYNPFKQWWSNRGGIVPMGKFYSCGNVYINTSELAQKWAKTDVEGTAYTWYAEVDSVTEETTIWANFGSMNPTQSINVVEINNRMQGITGEWGKKNVVVDGFTVMRTANPKCNGLWGSKCKGTYGAIATYGGYKWEIKNCKLTQNRGVCIDYGNGSGATEIFNGACGEGGEPELYGYHKIHDNYIYNNGNVPIFAYRGAYTEIYNNRLVNNNTLQAGLLSDAYIKDVNGGWGIKVHHNYIYSDQQQQYGMMPFWPDSECDGCEFTNNVVIDLTGTGLTNFTDECNNGWLLYANNIIVGVNYTNMGNSSQAYWVNNLFINSGSGAVGTGWSWGWNNSASFGGRTDSFAEGWDGYVRCNKLKKPGTLETLTATGNSTFRLECYNRYNRLEGNIFFDSGVNYSTSASEPALAEAKLGFTGVTYTGAPAGGNAVVAPGEGQDGLIPFDWASGPEIGTQTRVYGNSVDYNVYYRGAQKAAGQINPDRIDDGHSIVSPDGSYSIYADTERCSISIKVTDAINTLGAPMMTSAYMGKSYPYASLGVDFYAPSVDKDYFGKSRGSGATTIPGPFVDLKADKFNFYTLWPIN
jgi:hypothetical protein